MYHKDFILDQIIVSYKSQLEDGSLPKMKFHFLDNEVPVCGGLYAIKGDHMEKTQMAGIVGPGGDVPTFYTKTNKEDISDVTKKRKFRKMKHSKLLLTCKLILTFRKRWLYLKPSNIKRPPRSVN
jgi:hypothetical protein